MAAVLNGIRVLDFGRYIAGPYCAALLGDLGAEVIRIEKRDGSEDRTLVPVTRRADGSPGEGAVFLQMNRNKRGLTLDPAHPKGREIVKRLIKTADVVVVNLPPQTLRSLELDWPSVHALNPRTVLTTVSAFGSGGPYEERLGFDGVAQAMSGAVYLAGTEAQPVRSYASWVDFGTASLAAFGTMAALFARATTGRGQLVEGALLRTATTFATQALLEQDMIAPDRVPTVNRGQNAGPADIFKCKDGWITILVNGDPLFRRWARLMGEEQWLKDPRFANDQARGDNGAALSERTSRWCAERTVADALAELERAKLPAGPVFKPQQLLDDPHVNAAGYFASIDFEGLAKQGRIFTTPVVLSETPGTVRMSPPALGQHTDEILREIGCSKDDIAALREAGAI
ncbi:MAG: CoA transferase [Alphaproteobacteria bacterium]|nr:CoA transferase [Alphaproteobacteria bacterium]